MYARNLQDKIGTFYKELSADPHHRYRSWEHCYRFFRSRTLGNLAAEKDLAALHLGFYLASWGMYRGSAFLLQQAYTVHIGVVETLVSPQFSELWRTEAGSGPPPTGQVTTIIELVDAVKEAYKPFGPATDILATKAILGTVGCLPAVDRFFIAGFRKSRRQYSGVKQAFVAVRRRGERTIARGTLRCQWKPRLLMTMSHCIVSHCATSPRAKPTKTAR